MNAYLTFMFWITILNLVICGTELRSNHPRQPKPVNTGTDALRFIVGVAMLAWIAVLRWGGG